MGKASVTAKYTCGFSLDLVIKEKLIELSKYMNASMTVVVSYLINDGHSRMMKEKTIIIMKITLVLLSLFLVIVKQAFS